MYNIEYSGQFKKSLKLCKKRGLPLNMLHKAISMLAESGVLPPEYKPLYYQENMPVYGNANKTRLVIVVETR